MKVSELIESLQQAVAEVPAYADAEVLIQDTDPLGRGEAYEVVALGTEDDEDGSHAREDVLYLFGAQNGEVPDGEVWEWDM